jgi:hypothetical protein
MSLFGNFVEKFFFSFPKFYELKTSNRILKYYNKEVNKNLINILLVNYPLYFVKLDIIITIRKILL